MGARWLNFFAVCLVACAAALLAYGNHDRDQRPRLSGSLFVNSQASIVASTQPLL